MTNNTIARTAILKSVSLTVLFVSLFSFSAAFVTSAHAQDASTTDATTTTGTTVTATAPDATTTVAAVVAVDTTPTTTDSTIASTDDASTTDATSTDPAPQAQVSMRAAFVPANTSTTVSDGGSGSMIVIASAITCAAESDLPNWGNGGPSITASTASTYVAAHPSCHLASGWNFQWGHGSKAGYTGVQDPGAAFIGPVAPAPDAYNTWSAFGPTNVSGTATLAVFGFDGATTIWFREQLPAGYQAFSEADPNIQAVGHKNQVSAEMYCGDDVLNFDNYDAIYNAQHGLIYYCVTFNAPAANNGGNGGGNATNTPPTITLVGSNPLTITVNTAFTDPGATATDTEDGDITSHITASSTVSTTTIGTYHVVYSVTDSGGLSASTTRTVNVVAANNGGNGGGNATNTPPVITILGNNPETIDINTDYTDAGATATDTEDGDLTSHIMTTSTVSTTTVGTYAVTYTVTDSGGLTATSTRTVNVIDPNANNGGGNGGGGSCIGTCSGSGGGPNIGLGGGGGGGGSYYAAGIGGGGFSPAVTAPALSCPLLRDYLRIDFNNDPTEVVKLQAFLQRTEGFDVDVTGTFDQKTLAGVNAFQTKYLGQVMGPWGASRPSGYVYITTKKKINEIACATAFIINPSEQAIIDAYKANQAANGQNGNDNSTTTNPDIGLNSGATSSVALGNGLFNNPNTAGVANASILARFWDFLKSLFGRN